VDIEDSLDRFEGVVFRARALPEGDGEFDASRCEPHVDNLGYGDGSQRFRAVFSGVRASMMQDDGSLCCERGFVRRCVAMFCRRASMEHCLSFDRVCRGNPRSQEEYSSIYIREKFVWQDGDMTGAGIVKFGYMRSHPFLETELLV